MFRLSLGYTSPMKYVLCIECNRRVPLERPKSFCGDCPCSVRLAKEVKVEQEKGEDITMRFPSFEWTGPLDWRV